ncbi:hypothetical protein TRFO_34830 [Tritrichomonas foetus]|uniref:Uncharacterized protein n=1 Tax=Tritrichomonas foetus TaxID=1144522 RepID=A0A1J4JN50_9EUKA|nr:hypothetical protein TRFO_34830 [Tritrichomonas foetus]|eukprot:OHS98684.1 hypothetical protein TRFO_34830 [Tritrichomonas foetus]
MKNNHLTNSNSKEINNNNLEDVQMKQSLLISPKNKGNIVMKPNPRRSPKSKPIMMTTETQTDKKQSKKNNEENDVKCKPKLPEGRGDLKSPRNNIRTISRRTVEYSSSESDDEDGYKIPKIEVDHSRRSNYPDSNKGNNENNNQSSSKNNEEGKKSRSDSKSEGDEYDYDTENEFENKNGENCDDNTIVDKSNTNCYSIYQSQKDEPSDISHRSYSSYNSLNNDDFIDDNNNDDDSDYNDNNFNYSDQNDYNDNNNDSDNENESSKVENFDSFELISPIKLNAKVNQNMSSSTSNMQSGNYISDKLVSKEENEESNQNQEENSQSSIIEKNCEEESSNTLLKHEAEAQMVLSETKPKSDNKEENKNDEENKSKKNSSDQEINKESEKQQDKNNESSRVHSSIHSEPEKDNNDKDHEKESDKGNNQKDEFEFEEELPEVEKKKDEFEFEEEVDEYNEFEDDIADEKIRTAKLNASSKRTNRSELSESSNSLFNEFSDQGLMQNTDDAFEDISSSETDSGFDTLTKPQKKNEEVDPFEQISSDSSKDDEQDNDDRKTHNEKNVSENMEKEENIDQEKNIKPDDRDKDMKVDLENCEKNRSESPKSWEIELESSKMENSELDNNFLVDSDQEREESEKRKIESDQNRILSDERKEESDRNQIDSIFNRENVLENTLKKNSNSLIGSPNHRDSKMSQSSNGSKIFAYLEKQVQSSSSSSINQSNDAFNILSDHANNNENNVNENENETNKNFTNITGTYFGHEENETFNTPSIETTNHSVLSKSKSNSSSGNKNEDHNTEKHSNGLDGVKDDENLSVGFVQFVNSEQKNFEQEEIELVLSDTSDVEQVKNVSIQSNKISSDSIESDYSEVSSEKPMLNEMLDRAESLLNPNPTYELEEEFSNKENQIETKCDAKIDNKENFDFNEDSIIIDDSSEEEFLMTTGNSIEDKEKLLNENILNQKVEDKSKKVHQVQKEKDAIDEMINEKSSELAINDSFEQSLNIDETFSEENDQKSFNVDKEQDKPNLENVISNKVDSLFKVNENNEKETNQFEFDEKSESVIIDDSEINSFEDSVQLDLTLPNNDDNNPILEDKKVTDSKKVKIVDQSSDDLFEIKLDHESDDNKGENDQDNDNKNIAQIIESDGEKQINDIFNLLSSQNILLNKESENSQKDKISSAIKPKPKTPVRTGKIELDGDNSENDDSFDLSRVSSSPFTNGTFTISEDEAHKTSNLTLNDISKKVLPNPPKQEEQSCPNDKFTLKFKMPTVAQLKGGRIVFDNFSESAESDDLSFTENLDHSLNGKSETKENSQNKKEQTKTGHEATSFIDEDDDSFLE